MDQSALFLTLNSNWNDAIQWANQQLTEAGMRTVSTFDFQIARSDQVACTCPHHGTQACSCQMVVLLVYDDNQTPVSLLVHGYEDNTWFYLADSPSQLRNLELAMTVRQILERKKIEMENAMNAPINPNTPEPDSAEISNTIQEEPPEQGSRFKAWLNRRKLPILLILVTVVAFTAGSVGGYQLGIRRSTTNNNADTPAQNLKKTKTLSDQVNPSEGYKIPAKFGSIGPKLLAAGAIDYQQFEQIYANAGKPLTDEQKAILKTGSDQEIVINGQNAYFLLNLFWALGLTNENTILTKGPMMDNGKERVGNYASTGGWTIGTKSPTELFASAQIITLNSSQQALLEKVATVVYRPCCDNPTHFPDCNHGMAMLGLLELMASQNATEDQMFQAAKYINAFWYPQQSLEIATYFQAVQNADFQDAKSSEFVSAKYSSGSGFQAVHSYLVSNNLLQQAPSQGGSCGVR